MKMMNEKHVVVNQDGTLRSAYNMTEDEVKRALIKIELARSTRGALIESYSCSIRK